MLLHPGGAGVDARALGPNVGPLAARFHVYTPERRGHGHTPDVTGPITFDAMAQDTIAFLETVVGQRTHVLGCSDGATVGLLVALRRPDLIDRLVLAAGVFHFNGWLPQVIDPNNQPPEFLARLYEEVSPDGADHYPVVVSKLARLHSEEPTLSPDDLRQVESRTLIMVGDDDEVRLEHAVAMYRAIPDAELMVVQIAKPECRRSSAGRATSGSREKRGAQAGSPLEGGRFLIQRSRKRAAFVAA